MRKLLTFLIAYRVSSHSKETTCAKVLLAMACFALFGSAANAADLLYISEYTAPGISRGLVVQIPQEASLDQVTADFTSGQVQSNAFKSSTNIVRLVCTVQCSVLFGTNSTATSANKLLPALVPEYFAIPPGQNFKVFVQKTGGFPGSSYVGPGDIVSGAVGFYSCQAYSEAKVGTKAYRIVRASDSTQTDINSLPNGHCDTSTPATFCASTTCKFVTWYDQTGALACAGGTACDVTQSTSASQSAWTASALNGFPCATSTSSNHGWVSTNALALAQPFTFSSVSERTTAFTTIERIIASNTTGISYNYRGFTNTIGLTAGSTVSATASDSAFHAGIGMTNNASSVVLIDGTPTTGTTGTSTMSGSLSIGDSSAADAPLQGIFCEAGIWPSAMTTGAGSQSALLNANMHSRWGF